MEDRKKLLQYLISYPNDFKDMLKSLNTFSWDSEESLIELSDKIIIEVLNRYLSDEISAEELEEWANFIEFRDDVDYSNFKNIINKLANPLFDEEINKQSVVEIVKNIEILMH